MMATIFTGLMAVAGIVSCGTAPGQGGAADTGAPVDGQGQAGAGVAASGPAGGMVTVSADSPLITYTGRIQYSDPKSPRFAFPGIQIEAAFDGTGLDAIFKESGNRNWYDVSIDGAEPVAMQSEKGVKVHELARGLPSGRHTVKIYKRTEASCGEAAFLGFQVLGGSGLVQGDPVPERRLEFVGDSITCGYGNMISVMNPEKYPFTPANENSAQSWGALAAKALGARFVSTSYSGRGIFRNIDGTTQGVVPQLYDSVFPDRPGRVKWDHALYHPHVVVVNLGTNDYSSEANKKDLDKETFDASLRAAWKGFIARLREIHGKNLKVVCVVGPMLGDGYPAGQMALSRDRAAVSGVVDELKDAGDENIWFLELQPQSAPFGEDWHPDGATHRRMAREITELLKEITGW